MLNVKELWSNKKVRIGTMSVVTLTSLYFIAASMDTEKPQMLQGGDTKITAPVFGIVDSAENIERESIDEIVKSLNLEYDKKEKEMTAREKILKDELKGITSEMMKMQNSVFELETQLEAMNRGKAAKLDGREQNSRQAVLQGEDNEVEYVDNDLSLVRRPQTNIVTRGPVIKGGNVIRTVTQRKVREVKKSGVVEMTDIEVKTLSESNQVVNNNSENKTASDKDVTRNDPDAGEFALTMGSIISGTTLNGVAAPTAIGTTKEPIPVLMRIKKEAVMPNNFSLDIRDCHLLGSAVGDLSASRVYIRAEALSCITADGQAIEKNITAYAVSSSDGMAGIEGDVVSKTNEMVANTLTAGFWSGFSDAAAPNQVNALQTTPSANTLWQSQNLDRFAGAGVLTGASQSLSRLADYYMNMVEQTFPVVELLPGIQIDFIVQRGMQLKLEPPKRGE